MKFSSKKERIKIPHPSIDLVKDAYVSEDGIWSIHKQESLDCDGNDIWCFNFYILSHLPSGAKMPWTFATLKQAKAFCSEVSPIADWKNLRTKVVNGRVTVLPEKLRKAIGYQCKEIYEHNHARRRGI